MPAAGRTWAFAAAALAAAVVLAWLGLTGFAWSDYDAEASGAFAALVAGDWLGFLQAAPAYGGSLVLRAPFALGADALGGGELAIYRAVSVPGVLAAGALGVALARRARRDAWLVLALAAANPVSLRALEVGHPEELLGGALCVSAVLAAGGRRALLAGALLGLAVATKAWAVLAIGPVVLALPPGAVRWRALAVAAGVVALVLGPVIVGGLATANGVLRGGQVTGEIFQPAQLFWFLGEPTSTLLGGDGLPKPEGWRAAPAWLSPLTHPLIALLGLPASLWWARGRRLRGEHLLLLLAGLLLARCVLDPWNTGYYALPFLLSLLAWEVCCRPERPPVLCLAATALVWATFEWAPLVLAPDLQSVAYLAWALPLGGILLRAAIRTRPAALAPPELARARLLPA